MSRSAPSAGLDRKDSCTSTQDGLKLIELLQNFLVRQNEQVESLKSRISTLETERDFFIEKYHKLKATCANAIADTKDAESQTNVIDDYLTIVNNCTRKANSVVDEDSIEGKERKAVIQEMEIQEAQLRISESFSSGDVDDVTDGKDSEQYVKDKYETKSNIDSDDSSVKPGKALKSGGERRSMPSPVQAKLSTKRGSHVKRQNSKGRVDMDYVLSPDLKQVTVDLLANKYGGRDKANNAARIIQEYYRHWVFSKSFKRMRAYSEKRKRSITRPPMKSFEEDQLVGKSMIHNMENPVMIVDLTDEREENDDGKEFQSAYEYNEDASYKRTFSLDRKLPTKEDRNRTLSLSDEGRKRLTLSADSTFYCGQPSQGMVEKEILLASSVPMTKIDAIEDVEEPEVKKGDKNVEKLIQNNHHAKLDRCESSDSYEIIDEKQVLQVIVRLNDELSTGSCSSETSVSSESQPLNKNQSLNMSESSIFYDDEQYPPTVDKSRKWRYRIGINLFNNKPEDGIGYLVDNELLGDMPKSIAEFLRKETSISKQKISEYFGKHRKERNRQVLQEFATSFDFSGKEIDEALRQFQSYFKLTGEAQSIERFLQVFSERYVQCNPDGISTSVDTVLLLSFAMAMLNTDQHNENVKRRMTLEDFISNLRGTDDGKDFNPALLANIYNRIQKNEFSTGADHITQLRQIEQSFTGKIPTIAASQRQFVKLYTLHEVYDHNKAERVHFRLAFLFNDLLLLAKPRAKPISHGGGHNFSHKVSYDLLGMQLAQFDNEHYKYGVFLQRKIDEKIIARFSLNDEKTRRNFTEDLDDCIRETTGMNNIRIALSKTKQMPRANLTQSMTLGRKKMKKPKGVDDAISLLGVNMNSLETENLSKNRASSMLDISEATSDTESEPALRRSTSSTSLDTSGLSTNSKHASLPRMTNKAALIQKSPNSAHRRSFFGFSRRRKTSLEKSESTGTLERRREVGLSTFFHAEENLDEERET
eukprot:gene6050-6752_t